MARRLSPRRAALAALAVAVGALHLWLADDVLESRIGSGAAETRPKRIEVAFVRELAPTAPAPAPVRSAVRRPRVHAPVAAAAPAASAPAEVPPPEPVASAPEAADVPIIAAAIPPPEAPPASAPAASAPTAFEWPPSTRLAYALTGNYRGPVEGQAQVEWLRAGTRYQVHLDLSVGPAFAPLISRRVSSDGDLTEQGLRPRRYDEETKIAFRDPRRQTIVFDDSTVHLPGGRDQPLPAGVQDTASQFVQLTWLFTTQPELLEPGRSIHIPLALPRYVDTWTYDVLARETLQTPAGAVEAVHVKPRREPRPGVELTAEMWIAPSLQYLPVRIVIRQDAETFVDLLITRLPMQAQPLQAEPLRHSPATDRRP